MKIHRFYLKDTDLVHDFWMQDKALFHQWTNVLRFQVDRELILFNDRREERLYKITKIGDNAVHLELVTELKPNIPKTDIYLCFSLLKKDKNEWVLQKGTELGVSHFIPMICDRTEKTGFDIERAEKIVIEAAEQCGRTDIPRVREPLSPQTLVEELSKDVEIYVAEQGSSDTPISQAKSKAVLIGPEGGWTNEEKQFFESKNLKHIAISEFTLRAETAAITVATLLQ
jgi:16S rRNA (uracil1498-N3)-methyltransferase